MRAALLAWWLLPAERTEVAPSAWSVLLYYANFRAAAHPQQMSVFLPTWSLSTEEQFYAVWPTLLVLLYALRALTGSQLQALTDDQLAARQQVTRNLQTVAAATEEMRMSRL